MPINTNDLPGIIYSNVTESRILVEHLRALREESRMLRRQMVETRARARDARYHTGPGFLPPSAET
jgi:hypothetical protein